MPPLSSSIWVPSMRCLPKLEVMVPLSTGQGRFPLLFSNPTETLVTSGVFSRILAFLTGAAMDVPATGVFSAGLAVTVLDASFLASSSALRLAASISLLMMAAIEFCKLLSTLFFAATSLSISFSLAFSLETN